MKAKKLISVILSVITLLSAVLLMPESANASTKSKTNPLAKYEAQNFNFYNLLPIGNSSYYDGHCWEKYNSNDNSLPNLQYLKYFYYYDRMSVDYYGKIGKKNYDKFCKKYKGIHQAKDNKDYYISKFKNGVCINSYVGEKTNIVIPDKLEGLPVLKLGWRSYYFESPEEDGFFEPAFGDVKLKSITLPRYLKYIVNKSFTYDNRYVSSTLEYIKVHPKNKYYEAKDGILYSKKKKALLVVPPRYKKTEINVKDGTKALYIFSPETGSHILNLPASVKSLGEKYKGNKIYLGLQEYKSLNIKEVRVSSKNKHYTAFNGVLYDKKLKKLLYYPPKKTEKNFIVPYTVNAVIGLWYINDNSINSKLKSITFVGKRVKRIDTRVGLTKKKFTIIGYKGAKVEKFARKLMKKNKYDDSYKNVKFIPIG